MTEKEQARIKLETDIKAYLDKSNKITQFGHGDTADEPKSWTKRERFIINGKTFIPKGER